MFKVYNALKKQLYTAISFNSANNKSHFMRVIFHYCRIVSTVLVVCGRPDCKHTCIVVYTCLHIYVYTYVEMYKAANEYVSV